MSLPNDLGTLEKMQNMKNVIDDKFMEFVIPNIKTKQNKQYQIHISQTT